MLCECSNLDWRDVDQTQPHHPECPTLLSVNGQVEEHRFYAYALSSDEIRERYNSATVARIEGDKAIFRFSLLDSAGNLLEAAETDLCSYTVTHTYPDTIRHTVGIRSIIPSRSIGSWRRIPGGGGI